MWFMVIGLLICLGLLYVGFCVCRVWCGLCLMMLLVFWL